MGRLAAKVCAAQDRLLCPCLQALAAAAFEAQLRDPLQALKARLWEAWEDCYSAVVRGRAGQQPGTLDTARSQSAGSSCPRLLAAGSWAGVP